MFRRKEETADLLSEDNTINTGASASPSASTETQSSSSSSSYSPAPAAPASRPSYEPSRPAAPAAAAPAYRPAAPVSSPSAGTKTSGQEKASGKTNRRILTVGNDILLKGEIATCDRLVIEGKVDATLKDVHTVEIAETGSFKGTAQIEDAEISGEFEGELVVRNRLVIYASGKVRGKITYGEIEIERGGEITGEIKTISSAAQASTKPKAA